MWWNVLDAAAIIAVLTLGFTVLVLVLERITR